MSDLTGSLTATMSFGPNAQELTLTCDDVTSTPLKFHMPDGTSLKIHSTDLASWLSTKLGLAGFSSGLPSADINVTKMTVSTDKTFDLQGSFLFGDGQGWDIIPGITLNSLTVEVKSASTGTTPP